MVEILAYAFGIMYTPGPVNLLSLNSGLQTRLQLRFCAGVGCAMLLLFLCFGYAGAWLVSPQYQPIISLLGVSYIAYLAFKIFRASVNVSAHCVPTLSFKAGFWMQLLNPKAPVAILPIVTVQFPAAEISGIAISGWSLLLSMMAAGAPTSYMLAGRHLSRFIHHPRWFRALNMLMAFLLLYVAGDIFLNHVLDSALFTLA